MRLKDEVVIVTGSTRIIGEACALLFCREGARIVLTGRDETRGAYLTREFVKKESPSEISDFTDY